MSLAAWTEIDGTLGLVWHDLKTLLEPFGLRYFSTDGWDAYTCHLDAAQHTASKRYTQKMERKHLALRTRIARSVRTTILVSTRFLV
ncbi:MAG: IS1 family transposase [Candidatus Tectomicrobia bacterium]